MTDHRLSGHILMRGGGTPTKKQKMGLWGRGREIILRGSDSRDYHKTHHNIYRGGSVTYSSLSVQGLHTNGADYKSKINVIPKKVSRKIFIVRDMKIQ